MNSIPAFSIAIFTEVRVFTFPAGIWFPDDSKRTIVVNPIPANLAKSATVKSKSALAALIWPLVINLKLPYNDIKYISNVIIYI